MLVAEHVTKAYNSKIKANDDVSLCVQDGSIAVLLGPNGAGKSTLIKSITGLLRYQGRILIDGFDNKSIEAKQRLGYVPEMPAIYDLLTVGEHLEFITRAYKIPDNGPAAEQMLKRFALWDKRDKLGKELSKGMQQKLSICCTLIHHPRVVVFDEPLVGLDPHAIKQLKEVFLELKSRGASVLISTHMLDSVEDYWDVAYIMMDGKISAVVSAESGGGSKSLEQLFFEITEGGAGQRAAEV